MRAPSGKLLYDRSGRDRTPQALLAAVT